MITLVKIMDLISKTYGLILQTGLEILDKNKINNQIPILNGFVDLILVSSDLIICFKDFWTFNNLNTNILSNYLIGIEQIKLSYPNKIFVFALMTKNGFVNKNNINNNVLLEKNIIILEKNSQDKLLKELSYFLYSKHIYFYDKDFDTIMLD